MTKRQHLLCLVEAYRRQYGTGPDVSWLTAQAHRLGLYGHPDMARRASYRLRSQGFLAPPPGRGGAAVTGLELTASGQREIAP